MREIQGGVTAPQGFEAAAAAAKIKYENRTDMALVYSQVPCQAAGTFTSNVVKAAPVKWDQKIVEESSYAQAVIINAGIANACTGKEGMEYCRETARDAARVFSIPESAVLVASTGVIGMQLPMERIKKGIHLLKENKGADTAHGTEASKAIMTTDTVNKEIAVEFELGGKIVRMGGMCKGSGMIHPNMCTMLGFVTTDACISREMLQKAVKADVKDTFNMISVDGDTSTNDTLLVLANGMAGNPEIAGEGPDYEAFAQALRFVNTYLAKKMAGDGEGATALLEVAVEGCESREQAVLLAKSVVTSSLVKTAVYGHDANWGRILCAMGYSGVQFDPERVDLTLRSGAGTLKIVENGVSTGYSEELATKILSEPEVTILADVKMGEAKATAWGCDLTYDYVKINGDYRS